jgi:hypothetical protein
MKPSLIPRLETKFRWINFFQTKESSFVDFVIRMLKEKLLYDIQKLEELLPQWWNDWLY